MGLFSSIFKPVKKIIRNPVKAVTRTAAKVIKDPVRATLAVSTGGFSEVVRNTPVIGKPYKTAVSTASRGFIAAQDIYTGGLSSQLRSTALNVIKQPEAAMALDLGNILGTVSNIFRGNQNPIFEGISQVSGLAQQFVPQQALAMRPAVPMIPQAGRAAVGAMVGRSFFQKYPNLANAIQQLRARGMNVKRSQLWNLLKRFGPELVVGGGLLTAAAVNELMIAGPGRRHMNPANSKALRRAARRIKSFHKLCTVADVIKTRRRTIGRCGTCKRSPCRC